MTSDFALSLALVVGYLERYKGYATYGDLSFFTGRSESYLRAYVAHSGLFQRSGRPAMIRLSEEGRKAFQELVDRLTEICGAGGLNEHLECLRRMVGAELEIGGRTVAITRRVLKKEEPDSETLLYASRMAGGVLWNTYGVLNSYSEIYLEAAISFARENSAPVEALVKLSSLINPSCVEPRGGYVADAKIGAYAELVERLGEPERGRELEAAGVARRIGGALVPLDVPRLLARRARGSLDRAIGNYQAALRSAMRRAPPDRPREVAAATCGWEEALPCHKTEYGGYPYELLPAEGVRDEEHRFWIAWGLWKARDYDVEEAYREARALYASGVVRGPYAEWLARAPRRAQWLIVLALAAAAQSYPEAKGTEEEYLKALYEQARKRD
ncbi:MAG: hypothetical protein ACP5HD_08610 [Thermoproteus sp.]